MSEYINKYIATSIPVLPKEHRKQFTSYDDAFETGWNEALSCVNIVPTADVVEVRHGRWVADLTNPYGMRYICSECGVRRQFRSDYCPNCGAKMDEEEHKNG